MKTRTRALRPLHRVGAIHSTGCSAAGECSPVTTQSYLSDYFARHGGILVGRTRVNVHVVVDGLLEAVSVPGVQVGAAGQAQPGVEASAPVWLEAFNLVFPSNGPQRAPMTSERTSLLWLSLTDPDAVPIVVE